ncbi:MAG: hypothetical protein NTU58_02410, partial [Candidatus Nealsonbacteria bacterium]|nr:hypothetical protein [Candidatus Nealsonbacteria bacterium]
TIPSQRLDVNGQVRATDVCTTAGTCLSTAGGGFSKWTDSGSNIYNNNTGNVGIGKNNPSEKLDVNGNIKASGDICTGSKCLNSVGGGTNYWVGGSGSSIYYNSGNVGVGNLTLNPNGRITGLINPTVNSGAVPKSYADHFFAAPRTEPMECRLTYAARTISSTNPALTWTVSCASDEVAISGGVQTNGVFNLYVSSWPGPLNKDWTCVANYYAVVPGSQIASCYARCCKQTMMIMRYLEYCTYYGYAGCGLSNPPPLP